MKLLSLLCLSVLLASIVCDPQGGGAGGGGGGPDGSPTNNNQNTNDNTKGSSYTCAPAPDKTDKTKTWTPYKPRILQHLEACKLIDNEPESKVCGLDTTACKKYREEDAKDVHETHKDADIKCDQDRNKPDQEHECETKCATDSACAKPKSCSCGLCTITCMKDALRQCPTRFAVYFEFFKKLSEFDIKAESTFDSCRQLIDFAYERYSPKPTPPVAATDFPADDKGGVETNTDAPPGEQTTENAGDDPNIEVTTEEGQTENVQETDESPAKGDGTDAPTDPPVQTTTKTNKENTTSAPKVKAANTTVKSKTVGTASSDVAGKNGKGKDAAKTAKAGGRGPAPPISGKVDEPSNTENADPTDVEN